MKSYAETIALMERIDVDSPNTETSKYLTLFHISIIPLLDQLLFFTKGVVEYSSGIYIGAVSGWLLGLCTGKVYVGHFEPVYFSDLNEVRLWEITPYDFARNGAIIGLVAGVIAIVTINSRLLSHRVACLYEKEVTDPDDIGRVLGKSARQIKRKINKLAKKGKIICKKAGFSERICAHTANTY